MTPKKLRSLLDGLAHVSAWKHMQGEIVSAILDGSDTPYAALAARFARLDLDDPFLLLRADRTQRHVLVLAANCRHDLVGRQAVGLEGARDQVQVEFALGAAHHGPVDALSHPYLRGSG